MRWLVPEQRERMQSPDFYQLLQTHVTRKYLGPRLVATATAGGQQSLPAAGEKPWGIGPAVPWVSPAAKRSLKTSAGGPEPLKRVMQSVCRARGAHSHCV